MSEKVARFLEVLSIAKCDSFCYAFHGESLFKKCSTFDTGGYGMTTLKRVMVSLPRDLEAAVDKLRRTPELRNVPVSQILCRLIRKGLDADTKEELRT